MLLRDVIDTDLPVFFEHQQDPEARFMAAFTSKDPRDHAAFLAHWKKIRADASVTIRSIVVDGAVVGHVACYGPAGEREVTYWVGREHWGKGIATAALRSFLEVLERPVRARVAADNAGSLRVLEKCGFVTRGRERGFANARGAEIEELVLRLD
jgi:RimJ/RimL family protein N-acetyltransferase